LHTLRDGKLDQVGDLVNSPGNIDVLNFELPLSGVREQLARKVSCPLGARDHFADFCSRPRRNFVHHQTGITQNPGQQVVEIVGYPACEEADALQFLRLPQTLFIAFPFRDIQHYTGVPNRATRFCFTRELCLASDLNPSHAVARPN
jgi:hypothetical protein